MNPWDNEPDRLEFEHKGLPCLLQRGPSGAWCGYVAVNERHPLWGHDYMADDFPGLKVHGGVTYSEFCRDHICHVPKPGEKDNVYWIGFDCSHHNDLRPTDRALLEKIGFQEPWMRILGHGTYRTIDYAKRETEALAEQLAAMA